MLIMDELDEFDYPNATALAAVMLVVSFVLLLTINVTAMVDKSSQHA